MFFGDCQPSDFWGIKLTVFILMEIQQFHQTYYRVYANAIQGSIWGDVVVFSHRGFVPVKPFIFSDGEVLGEHAQACYYSADYCYKKWSVSLFSVSQN